MKLKIHHILFLCLLSLAACNEKIEQPDLPPEEDEKPGQNDGTQDTPDSPSWPDDAIGKEWVWDDSYIPEIKIDISRSQWNQLLIDYDKNAPSSAYFKCNVVFEKNGTQDNIPNAGIRVKDNEDRSRPAGNTGEYYNGIFSEWHQSNFEIDFQRYDDKQSLRYVNGLYLKSCTFDPSYSRERFCHDLFRKLDIWTIAENIYCRLSIQVEGDEEPAYLGVYQMIEPINQDYLLDRAGKFKNTSGNLWKCSNGASLSNTNNPSTGIDDGTGTSFSYQLVTTSNSLSSARQQLIDFMTGIKLKTNDEFHTWIQEVCDVELLLRTYATNVTVGMCNDYWNAGNNYYLYFDSASASSYKVYFIPYNYEMSLGNSRSDLIKDTAIVDPYNWGRKNNPLISRLLAFEDFRRYYTSALQVLTDSRNDLFSMTYAAECISGHMSRIAHYTDNITGTNMTPEDKPSVLSYNKSYKLTTTDNNSFFKKRIDAIYGFIY